MGKPAFDFTTVQESWEILITVMAQIRAAKAKIAARTARLRDLLRLWSVLDGIDHQSQKESKQVKNREPEHLPGATQVGTAQYPN